MSPVLFHIEDIPFELSHPEQLVVWITSVIKEYAFEVGEINYIFCSDEYLLNINKEYLDHDYYTDIITFDQSEDDGLITGDIFISIDRVKENANQLHISFNDELNRVMIHGILHLVGINDKTPSEKSEMRKLEDHYLALREF